MEVTDIFKDAVWKHKSVMKSEDADDTDRLLTEKNEGHLWTRYRDTE